MMATYFHGGSEIQPGDNLQTLYLMNPNYVAAYTSEAHNNNPAASHPPSNMLLLNPSAGLGPGGLPSPPPQQPGHQQFIGIPLSGPHSENPGRPSHHHPHHQIPGSSSSLHGVAVSRVHYNLWSPASDSSPIPTALVATSGGAQGGLSLSLSPQQQNNNNNGGNNPVGIVSGSGGDNGRMSVTVVGGGSSSVSNGGGVQGVILGSKYLKAAQELLDEVVNVESYCSSNNNNKGAMSNNGDSGESSGAHKDKAKDKEPVVEGSGAADKKAAEQLSTAQRQELQMKKAKLLNMLDEVEQRYRQYHTQMQLVVSSFEQAAGLGSAKSYTSLALQTISRQFRCLKDAIVSQIKATSKSLGEEDASGGGSKLDGVGSRLRFVDHQLRQQRALQQLGMMQHNAWRPQRGLPERAVSVLRAWLFEHFLHPYPKDSDKHMLAKQTGLTRSQVSNWFINARVRLWKPMVEEMYMEEMKSQEQNGGNSENNNNNNNNNNANNNGGNPNGNEPTSKATAGAPQQQQQHHQQNEQHHDGGNGGLIQAHHQQASDQHQTTNDMISNLSTMSTTSMSSQGFTLIGSSSDMESLMARSPKKQRSMQSSPSSILSMDMEMKPPDHHHHQRQSPMIIANHHHQGGGGASSGGGAAGFNPYMVNDMGRFNPDQLITAHHHHHQYQGGGNNNGAVSLTLGLPHCENQTLSHSGNHQQSFIPNQGMQLGRRLDIAAGEDQGTDFCGISMGMGQPSHPNNGYETIDIQSRKRFAAHQLLHDFVA